MAAPVKANELLQQMLRAMQTGNKLREEKPAEGYLTVKQWSKIMNLADSSTRRIIRELKEKGLVEEKLYVINTGAFLRRVPHFKVKQ